MEKEFVPYELAVRLKELGFDEPCIAFATMKYKDVLHCGYRFKVHKESDLPTKPFGVPTRQSAFRWFREKHGLWQIVMQNTDKDWTYDIIPIIGMIDYKLFDVFDTYEEAELACLTKLIEIVEQTKNK